MMMRVCLYAKAVPPHSTCHCLCQHLNKLQLLLLLSLQVLVYASENMRYVLFGTARGKLQV